LDAPKALVVDPDRWSNRLLRILLEEAGYRAASAADGAGALDELARGDVDLVLLELALPGGGGPEACRSIREASDAALIALSGRERAADGVAALRWGADDYVTKPFAPAELMARVAAVLRRRRRPTVGAAGPAFAVGEVTLDPMSSTATVGGRGPIPLTATEARLLLALMRAGGRALTREDLRERVWGADHEGGSNEVDVFVGRLRRKLEPDPAGPRYILTDRHLGYRFVGRPADDATEDAPAPDAGRG
jgi:DNA-binding response OmpR family regulator